ncbi:MAG: RloB family protein [Muribaculaceae bacterium]|nr:RloB family protein [Muribaculaceae bacterium]
MDIRATRFTVKIFGEGLTEWYYFDKLRSKRLFSFALDPGFPTKSRSSYKKRLPLIDKELAKPADERANLLVLITDLDNIVNDPSQYKEYQKDKERYEAQGVVFIESHPCIELWFMYHFDSRYEKTNFATYDEIKDPLRKHLPGYDKSKAYYTGNVTFRNAIIESYSLRANAACMAEASRRYPAAYGEISNHTNLHQLVVFLHMMQFCYTLADYLRSIVHSSFSVEPDVKNLEKINICVNGNFLISLKAERGEITCKAGTEPVSVPLGFDFRDCSAELNGFFKTLATTVSYIVAQNLQ